MINDLWNSWRRALIVGVCVLLCLGGPVRLLAQTGANLTGTVVDADGKVVPDATVAVKGEGIDYSRTVTTGDDGRFSITGVPAGSYTIDVTKKDFAVAHHPGVQIVLGKVEDISIPLSVGNVSEEITVTGSMPVAAQLAPIQNSLEARTAESEISEQFIDNFASPVADFTELLQMAPGTFSVNPNGVGLGQSNTYFRGFSDGQYNIDFDGIPFFDTNTPSHHSWSFFPSQDIGDIVFDRSPGTAATVGPTPFGGSIHLLSRNMSDTQNIRGTVSYGSFSTLLAEGTFDSGKFGSGGSSHLLIDAHEMTSDGYQTYNYQKRRSLLAKYQYQISPNTTFTLFTSVIDLDSNTPNTKGPTRAQVALYGDNFLLTGTPGVPTYYGYNTYHVPTDFEYFGVKSDLGHGWTVDDKVFTYYYWNQQFYNSATKISATSATDKLNGYRKLGDVLTLSYANKLGTFRTGMWIEDSWTNRYQIPSSPLTMIDSVLPNFHQKYTTEILQPYVEYEFKVTPNLSITPGIKLAWYKQDFTQFPDNGTSSSSVGSLNGAPFATDIGQYRSYLPSLDAHYKLERNWAIYGQYGTGSVIPPTSVFSTTNGLVDTLPKPTTTWALQTGSVWKSNRFTLDTDIYYVHFQNTYSSTPDATGEPVYYLGPDSVTKGIEAESNIVMLNGLSLYLNGTAGEARYVGTNQWVQQAPQDTATTGLTYQKGDWDMAFLEKRIGFQYNDNGSTHDAVPIEPFNITNLFLNYTVKNDFSFLAHTKVRFAVNNVFDKHNIVGVAPAATTTSVPAPGDVLTLLPGRSVSVSLTAGVSPKW